AAPCQSTTSTTGLRQAGAKKCVTVQRPGCCMCANSVAAGNELELDVIQVVSATRASSCSNRPCLSDRFSVAASSTQSASARESSARLYVTLPRNLSACCNVRRLRLTALTKYCSMRSAASSSADCDTSTSTSRSSVGKSHNR